MEGPREPARRRSAEALAPIERGEDVIDKNEIGLAATAAKWGRSCILRALGRPGAGLDRAVRAPVELKIGAFCMFSLTFENEVIGRFVGRYEPIRTPTGVPQGVQ